MIAVTGSTGHIGNVLVRELLKQEEEVRIVIPPFEKTANLKDLDVEKVIGDVRDVDSLLRAFDGVDVVYHLAGIVSILPGKSKLLDDVNVKGTNNVIQACLKSGVRRLIYTSSVHAFVEPPDGVVIDESQQFDPEKVFGEYAKSKARATLEVFRGIQAGLDIVIVFPTGVIGPYDYKPSEMGQLIKDFAQKKVKAYISGAYNFVDVRDVAKGLILSCKKGCCGEGYILSGSRITVKELILLIEDITGIKTPTIKIPTWLAKTLAIFTPLYYNLTNMPPRFTSYSIRVLHSNSMISCEKASRELGYSSRPIRETIADSLKWFRETGRL
ncbi:MAG: SDR family oxidoreductase [Halanaerobiales bacterium]|nr:SDR family oxidoreductase [Halanaerobiales bacterium]